MQEQYHAIGEAAGKIYQALEKGEERSVSELERETGVSDRDLFNQALGWLAREDKLKFNRETKIVKFSLNKVKA